MGNPRRDRYVTDPLLGACKQCCRCGEAWPADREFFHTNARYDDGLSHYCIACATEMKSAATARRAALAAGEIDATARYRLVAGRSEKRCTACERWLPATTEHFRCYSNGCLGVCAECARAAARRRYQQRQMAAQEVAHG